MTWFPLLVIGLVITHYGWLIYWANVVQTRHDQLVAVARSRQWIHGDQTSAQKLRALGRAACAVGKESLGVQLILESRQETL